MTEITTPKIRIEWGNTHADHCPVTKGRKELENTLNNHFRWFPNNADNPNETLRILHYAEWAIDANVLWGAIVEHDIRGDEEAEGCTCNEVAIIPIP